MTRHNRSDRFVILHHLAPTGEHWDLMLERGDVLLAWQLTSRPADRAACPIKCIRVADHRKRYLDYEGPISGGRGIVTRFDRGCFELLEFTEDRITFELSGDVLSGRFRLDRPAESGRSQWVFSAF